MRPPSRSLRLAAAVLVTATVAAACGSGSDTTSSAIPQPATSTTASTATTITTPATTTTAATIDWGAIASTWMVSLRGVGPYRIEMSLADAEREGGAALVEIEDTDPSCSYYTHDPSTGLDQELRFMVRSDRIVRIDIVGLTLVTLSGVGVGSTQSDVLSTYGEAVVASPAPPEEDADSYVTFIPSDEADANLRLRFEIVDDVVSAYRIGRLPEVEWVARCGDE